MEDWRSAVFHERRGRTEAVMLKVARQKKWVHWVLWCFPVVNLIGSIISAIQIRDWRPIAGGVGVVVLFTIANSFQSSFDFALFIASFLLFFGGISFALWTQQIIQDTREEIDRKNNR